MSKRLRIFYDADCPRCRRLVERSARLDIEERLDWRDLNSNLGELAAAGVDAETALTRLHVIDESGRVHGGVSALALVWDALPRRRFLAVLARLPLLSAVVERIYSFVARRRKRDEDKENM